MAESKAHKRQVRAALTDKHLRIALDRAVDTYVKARDNVMTDFDLEKSQSEVRALKEHVIANLDTLFAQFKQEAEDVGAVVHEARDGKDVAEIIAGLARERGVKSIVKSKSLLTDEIELNPRLQSAGLEVVETDLGEWIIQLSGEKPSHFTQPAVHKTREQVAELFSKATGEQVEADIQKLVELARRRLRQAFIDADMGITGANIAIAETGGIVIVSNEGNVRLVSTLPPIHVVVVGYEKLVPTMEDATAILKVLSKSGTGQKQTAYVSFITSPSRTTDIEKTLTLGVHGPKEVHIIFVDSGRKAMAADEKCKEGLYCIKCGACLNMCPVYRAVGGHAFGNAYMGGIGAVVTAFHRDLDATEDTLGMCTGCAYCTSVCPSKIDTPGMILELRKRLAEKHGIPLAGKLSLAALRNPGFFQRMIRTARAFQKPFVGEDGLVKDFPLSMIVGNSKKYPRISSTFLRESVQDRSSALSLTPTQHPKPVEGAAKDSLTVSLFAGCMIDFVYPEIGEAMWKVISGSGARMLFSQGQSCCGAPAIYSGDHYTARKLAMDNIAAMEEGSPDYIVTGCPTCAVVLKEQFPKLLEGSEWAERAEALSSKVMDFSQFASDVLNIKLDGRADGTVTYHDPCHQIRGLKTSGCARKLISETGAELIEMVESDQCCGFAGSYSIKQEGISGAVLDRKIKHIEETGAGKVLTDCPGCIMQIRGGLLKCGSDVEVRHTAQMIAELIGSNSG
ncbi:MAG: LUD domain-containing protein [Chloroflexi bacterium]|nr:LUD domain-containing protein [Chloroflexota bacterium]